MRVALNRRFVYEFSSGKVRSLLEYYECSLYDYHNWQILPAKFRFSIIQSSIVKVRRVRKLFLKVIKLVCTFLIDNNGNIVQDRRGLGHDSTSVSMVAMYRFNDASIERGDV